MDQLNPVADELRALLADPLTPREMEVLGLIVEGWSNEEIATRLGVRIGTVKAFVTFVLAKLGVSGRSQAAYLALLLGLVRIEPGSEGARIVELRQRMRRC
jgi:DNA-binding NarL/FixJ family response regulator